MGDETSTPADQAETEQELPVEGVDGAVADLGQDSPPWDSPLDEASAEGAVQAEPAPYVPFEDGWAVAPEDAPEQPLGKRLPMAMPAAVEPSPAAPGDDAPPAAVDVTYLGSPMMQRVRDIFECSKCGNCCKMTWSPIWINRDEGERIARAFGLTTEEVAERYTVKQADRRRLRQKADGWCVFYDHDKGCTIDPVKPDMCRAFPFHHSAIGTQQAWQRTLAICPEVRKGANQVNEERHRGVVFQDVAAAGGSATSFSGGSIGKLDVIPEQQPITSGGGGERSGGRGRGRDGGGRGRGRDGGGRGRSRDGGGRGRGRGRDSGGGRSGGGSRGPRTSRSEG